MNETSKCYQSRLRRGDFHRFLNGNGIDIGCGPDPLEVRWIDSIRTWDLQDGDAQKMSGVQDGHYNFVYSSHCLEHMRDVPEALKNWCRILRPGGAIYVVVPDYYFYEKCQWPSRFNPDHKQSFSMSITREQVGRPNHWQIEPHIAEVLQQNGVELKDVRLEIDGYDFSRPMEDQTLGDALSQITFIGVKKQ